MKATLIFLAYFTCCTSGALLGHAMYTEKALDCIGAIVASVLIFAVSFMMSLLVHLT